MSSGMQPACQGLSPLNYGWQLIGGVHVTVWYNSLQLPTQEEIKIHHKGNCEIELVIILKTEKVMIGYQMSNLTMIVILSRYY